MTHKAKDLSPDQRMAIESLLGRAIAEDEEISVRATKSPAVTEWLHASWQSAQEQGVDRLSVDQIDADIEATQKARRLPLAVRASVGQSFLASPSIDDLMAANNISALDDPSALAGGIPPDEDLDEMLSVIYDARK